jgi:hypothetical protein
MHFFMYVSCVTPNILLHFGSIASKHNGQLACMYPSRQQHDGPEVDVREGATWAVSNGLPITYKWPFRCDRLPTDLGEIARQITPQLDITQHSFVVVWNRLGLARHRVTPPVVTRRVTNSTNKVRVSRTVSIWN